MFTLKTVIASISLMLITLSAALPQGNIANPTTGGVRPIVPDEVEIMYFQGWDPTSTSCGTVVSNGTLHTNTCTRLCTEGIAVRQIPEADCLLTVYHGTQTCTKPTEIVSYAIQKGSEGMVCVDVGVLEGCEGETEGGVGGASGVWTCG